MDKFLGGLKKVNFNMVYNVALGVIAAKLVGAVIKAVVTWAMANLNLG